MERIFIFFIMIRLCDTLYGVGSKPFVCNKSIELGTALKFFWGPTGPGAVIKMFFILSHQP